MPYTFEDVLELVKKPETQISVEHCLALSDLTLPQVEAVVEACRALPAERKVNMLRQMAGVAEEDFHYDFGKVMIAFAEDAAGDVRLAALEGLWDEHRTSLIPLLTRLLAHDEDPRVRALAAVQLGRFIDAAIMEEISEQAVAPAISVLRTAFNDADEHIDVRRRALEALSFGDEHDIDVMIEEAYYAEDLDMYMSSLFAMGRTANKQWVPYLLEGLTHELAPVRAEAMRALGNIGDPETVVHIASVLAEESESIVRFEAIMALGEIGGSDAKSLLTSLLESDDPEMVEAAEVALEGISIFEQSAQELIDIILAEAGIAEGDEDAWDDVASWEDATDAEIRRLLDERDID